MDRLILIRGKTSHADASSPRPLRPMLSECRTSTKSIHNIDLNNATFEWMSIASNEKTGAQFDAWRIVTHPPGSRVEASNQRIF